MPMPNSPLINWSTVDSVLLDMDGTLLDLHFDNYFWHEYVPKHYANRHQLDLPAAKSRLSALYRQREGTLDWTDLDFWSNRLQLDIPALKLEVNHLIRVHPHVLSFLEGCRKAGKRLYLVTNAHSKTLAIKLAQTPIGPFFHTIICSLEIGMPKEDPRFWDTLTSRAPYEKERALLVDDTETVLRAAQGAGIANLIHIAKASSQAPAIRSRAFRSIDSFKELLPVSGP